MCDNYGLFSDAQFGFRLVVTTTDAKTLASKNIYCFVDFRKSFDYVDRLRLWYKLHKLGVRGTFLSGYTFYVLSCDTINGKCSHVYLLLLLLFCCSCFVFVCVFFVLFLFGFFVVVGVFFGQFFAVDPRRNCINSVFNFL